MTFFVNYLFIRKGSFSLWISVHHTVTAIYLTREEFSARSNGPINPYREGEQFIILLPRQRTRLFTQWGATHPTQALGLVYRPDPNAGVPPADDGVNGYEDPWDEETGDFRN